MAATPQETQHVLALISALQTDFRTLSTEASKLANSSKSAIDTGRYKDIGDTSERAAIKLRALSQPNKASQNSPITQLQSSVIYTPLLYACQTKHTRLTLTCMNIIQRLIVLEPLDSVFVKTVISILRVHVELNDSVIQLKILQSLLQLIRVSTVECITGHGTVQCLLIAVKLMHVKDKMICNTSVATMQQIIDILFEYVSTQHNQQTLYATQTNGHATQQSTDDIDAESQKPSHAAMPESPRHELYSVGHEAETLNDVAKHTYMLLVDLCNIVMNDDQHKPQVFVKPNAVQQTIALDSIELALQHNTSLLCEQSVFRSALMHNVVPAVVALLHSASAQSNTFPLTLRAVRCTYMLLKQYYHVDEAVTTKLIQSLISLLNSKTVWHQLLAADCLNQLSHNTGFMYYTHAACSVISSTPIFATMINALSKYINNIDNYNAVTDTSGDTVYVWRLVTNSRVKYLELLSEDTAPDKADTVDSVSLVIDAVINTIHNFNTLLTQAATTPTASTRPSIDKQQISNMIDTAWLPILNLLAFLLNRTIDVNQTRQLFTSMQNLIDTCGAVNLSKARDNIVYALCTFALPRSLTQQDAQTSDLITIIVSTPLSPDQQPLLTSKNTQALNVVFIMIKSLNEHLDSSWLCILETMQQLDMIVAACNEVELRSQRDNNVPDHITATLPSRDELHVLQNNLQHIANSTVNMSDIGVTAIVTALGTLSLSSLANAAIDSVSSTSPSLLTPAAFKSNDQPPPSIQSFALSNLLRIIELNMPRLLSAQLWEQVIAHLASVVSHRNVQIRQYGLYALVKLTIDALTHKDLMSNDLDKSTMIQTRLLTPLLGLWRNKYDDTRESLLHAVHSIIQTVGPTLHSGWAVILQLLQAVVAVDTTQSQANVSNRHVATGFNCVQLICNDYLDVVPADMYDQLITTVADYCKQQTDTNISFTSIGLLWRISDHLLHMQQPTVRDNVTDQLVYNIFTELFELSTDVRSEVRNSACRTLHSTVAAHLTHSTDSTLLSCLKQLILPLLSELLSHNNKSSQNAHGTELGTDKAGNKVMMLAHYSRNTAAKQWNETCVYAMQGSTQLFTQLIETRSTMAELYQLVQQYIQAMKHIVVMDNSEVVNAAIISACSLLRAAHNNPAIWSATVDMYLHSVSIATKELKDNLADNGMHNEWLKTVTQLLTSIELILSSDLNETLKEQYNLPLIDATQKIMAGVAACEKDQPSQITSVHIAYLSLCQNCTQTSGDLTVLVLGQLLKVIAGDTSSGDPFAAHAKAVASADTVIKLPACSLKYQPHYAASYTTKAMRALDVLYSKSDSKYARAVMFEPVLTVLYSVFKHYSTVYTSHTDLIDATVTTLSRTLQYGLNAVNSRGYSSSVATRLFTMIYCVFELTLSKEHTLDVQTLGTDVDMSAAPVQYKTPRSNPDEQRQFETLQIHVIDCMVQSMLPHSSRASDAMLKHLLLLININVDYSAAVDATTNSLPYQSVSHKCTETLFELCSISYIHTEEQLRVAELAVPLLISRIRTTLQTYIKTIQSQFMHVSPPLHQHILYIMHELLKHKLPEFELYRTANSQAARSDNGTPEHTSRNILTPKKMLRRASYGKTGDVREYTSMLQGSSTYITQLLPLLCDCVISDDKEIRLVLSSVIKLVTNDLYAQVSTRAR